MANKDIQIIGCLDGARDTRYTAQEVRKARSMLDLKFERSIQQSNNSREEAVLEPVASSLGRGTVAQWLALLPQDARDHTLGGDCEFSPCLRVDEHSIIDVLTKCSNAQRQDIAFCYERRTKQKLEDKLHSALSDPLRSVILGLLKTPVKYDASEVRGAVK
eukprot:g42195.t1